MEKQFIIPLNIFKILNLLNIKLKKILHNYHIYIDDKIITLNN